MFSWVKKYIGTPFVSGGRDFSGCDCYGLVRLILEKEYCIELPEFVGDYTNALAIAQTKKLFIEKVPVLCGKKILIPEPASVCLVVGCGCLCHVGLYAGGDYIIHCKSGTGTICERLGSPRLKGRIEGWYRIDKSYCKHQSFHE